VAPRDRVLDISGNRYVFDQLREPVESGRAIAFSGSGTATMTVGEERVHQVFAAGFPTVIARLHLSVRVL
jgi:hypothetical protein